MLPPYTARTNLAEAAFGPHQIGPGWVFCNGYACQLGAIWCKIPGCLNSHSGNAVKITIFVNKLESDRQGCLA